jgi:hypothetical protein
MGCRHHRRPGSRRLDSAPARPGWPQSTGRGARSLRRGHTFDARPDAWRRPTTEALGTFGSRRGKRRTTSPQCHIPLRLGIHADFAEAVRRRRRFVRSASHGSRRHCAMRNCSPPRSWRDEHRSAQAQSRSRATRPNVTARPLRCTPSSTAWPPTSGIWRRFDSCCASWPQRWRTRSRQSVVRTSRPRTSPRRVGGHGEQPG